MGSGRGPSARGGGDGLELVGFPQRAQRRGILEREAPYPLGSGGWLEAEEALADRHQEAKDQVLGPQARILRARDRDCERNEDDHDDGESVEERAHCWVAPS